MIFYLKKEDQSYNIFITKDNEVLPWKKFNRNMAVSLEYDLKILVKSLYHFIIKPLDKRYDNIKKVGNKELIINSSIENHIFVSKKAVVVSTPAAYATKNKSW